MVIDILRLGYREIVLSASRIIPELRLALMERAVGPVYLFFKHGPITTIIALHPRTAVEA